MLLKYFGLSNAGELGDNPSEMKKVSVKKVKFSTKTVNMDLQYWSHIGSLID